MKEKWTFSFIIVIVTISSYYFGMQTGKAAAMFEKAHFTTCEDPVDEPVFYSAPYVLIDPEPQEMHVY